MSLEAIVGEESTFSAEFFSSTGAPVDPTGTPTYSIYDHLNNLILSGSGIQDEGAPERWVARAVIPSGVIPSDAPDEHYRITWTLQGRDGVKYSFNERFDVYSTIDEELAPLEAIFALEQDSTIQDMIVTQFNLISYTYQIVDPINSNNHLEAVTIDNPEPFQAVRDNYYYREDLDISPISININDLTERQVKWELQYSNGEKERELHSMYIASLFVMKMVKDIRQIIDKGQQWRLNQSLNISDWEIIFCLLQAMDRINASAPQLTFWTVGSLPPQMRTYLTGYTSAELLNQLYLAHGLAAFDFQGQSTQLSMDSTQFIQTMRDSIISPLDERIVVAKKIILRQTQPLGVLSVNIGPSSNYPISLGGGLLNLAHLRSFLFRRL